MNRLSVMGELAASLAHEITQPIASARNNVRAALNFLDRQPPDLGEVREALDFVVGDADRAGAIIDRIRDQMKKAPPQKDRFDLNEAINEVIVLARGEITKNGVSVDTHPTEGALSIEGDRVQLQQVVLNLVMNAVEAMGSVQEGPRELSISTEQTQANGVLVAVRDSGPGVDPENIERVFEPFYTTKSSGVGMGLSICRSIIDAHGGRLWAEANEPRGSVFQFTLPSAEKELMNSASWWAGRADRRQVISAHFDRICTNWIIRDRASGLSAAQLRKARCSQGVRSSNKRRRPTNEASSGGSYLSRKGDQTNLNL